jgi:hypothetical protein
MRQDMFLFKLLLGARSRVVRTTSAVDVLMAGSEYLLHMRVRSEAVTQSSDTLVPRLIYLM